MERNIWCLICGLALGLGSWGLAGEEVQVFDQFLKDEAGKKQLDLNGYIASCRERGRSEITIPPGVYYIKDTVRLSGLENAVLAGGGQDPQATKLIKAEGIFFQNGKCKNATVRNFTLDYDPLPFTQGTITAVEAENSTFTFELHAGYPPLPPDPQTLSKGVFFYDAQTRLLKEHISKGYWGKVEKLGDRTGRIKLAPHTGFAQLQPGDMLVLLIRSGAVFRTDYCTDMTYRDLVINTGPGLAFGTYYSNGKFLYKNIRIDRGPPPAGATQARLMTTTADGMQHRICQTGPTLEDCYFAHMGDDGFNNSSLVWPVAAVLNPREVVMVARESPRVLGYHSTLVDEHSQARLVRAKSFELLDSPPVESITDYPEMHEEPQVVKDNWPRRGDRFRKVRFRRDLAPTVKAGDGIYLPFVNSRGYVIRNCTFFNVGANGLRIMGEEGLIENCRIEHTYLSGIALPNNMSFWMEAGPVRNCVIRHNVVRDTGLDDVARQWYSGAIQVSNAGLVFTGEQPTPPATLHQDISILDNVIENSNLAGIYAAQTDGLTIKGNVIRNVNRQENTAKLKAGYAVDHAIGVQMSRRVVIEGNRIENPGPAARGAVANQPFPEGGALISNQAN